MNGITIAAAGGQGYDTRGGDVVLLDGAVGTELAARGVPIPAPEWSAAAIRGAPEVLRAIHADYARVGAQLHTACTFRTRRRDVGERWAALAAEAVRLCRAAIPGDRRVAGSVGPLADCYRPDLSPPEPRAEHRELCRALALAGVDLLLCETFAHPSEALIAVEEAVATGLQTWVSFTAGPTADLLTPRRMAEAAREAVARGASAVLVNCVPASRTLAFVDAIATCGAPFGAKANAGGLDEGLGWGAEPRAAAERYLEHARRWVDAGATLVGGCCGTGPAHVEALAHGL